jgi:LAO/AO transport system kinase
VQILKTEAISGKGIDALLNAVARHRAEMAAAGTLAERRRRNLVNEVVALAASRLRARLAALVREDAAARALLDAVVDRRLDPASAAREILAGELTAKLTFAQIDENPDRSNLQR